MLHLCVIEGERRRLRQGEMEVLWCDGMEGERERFWHNGMESGSGEGGREGEQTGGEIECMVEWAWEVFISAIKV